PPRHTLFPYTTLFRSQERQKGAVVEATIPNVAPSGRRKRSAGALESPVATGVMGPYRAERTSRISRCENTCAADHPVAPPTSMRSEEHTSELQSRFDL